MKFEFEYQCDKEWDEMKGGDRQRHCDSCNEKVHHISGMTKEQALRFLEENDFNVCVDFFRDGDGNTVFSERERKLAAQGDGIKQLLAAALAVIPLALGAAFIDFDAETAEVATFSEPQAPPPLELGGPSPVIVNTTSNADLDIDIDVPSPALVEEEPDIAPVVEELPEADPEPIIRPPRPHVRGRIKRPANWD